MSDTAKPEEPPVSDREPDNEIAGSEEVGLEIKEADSRRD
jgi:hypothetical protein